MHVLRWAPCRRAEQFASVWPMRKRRGLLWYFCQRYVPLFDVILEPLVFFTNVFKGFPVHSTQQGFVANVVRYQVLCRFRSSTLSQCTSCDEWRSTCRAVRISVAYAEKTRTALVRLSFFVPSNNMKVSAMFPFWRHSRAVGLFGRFQRLSITVFATRFSASVRQIRSAVWYYRTNWWNEIKQAQLFNSWNVIVQWLGYGEVQRYKYVVSLKNEEFPYYYMWC